MGESHSGGRSVTVYYVRGMQKCHQEVLKPPRKCWRLVMAIAARVRDIFGYFNLNLLVLLEDCAWSARLARDGRGKQHARSLMGCPAAC